MFNNKKDMIRMTFVCQSNYTTRENHWKKNCSKVHFLSKHPKPMDSSNGENMRAQLKLCGNMCNLTAEISFGFSSRPQNEAP